MKNKNWVPFARAKDIYSIPLSFYRDNNIKVILSDLDNTLDSYLVKKPSKQAKVLVQTFQKEGLLFLIASNNTSQRVKRYSRELKIPAFSGLWKPFGYRLRKLIKQNGFNPKETVLIGDQILTDIVAGNRAGIRTILTEPLTKNDQFWTRINRFFEKRKRLLLSKMPYSKEWKGTT